MKNRKGFTLLELMAVVAIIAILSAMALGGYRKAIERSAFNEGVQVVHALAAAADGYYYDNHAFPGKLSDLDVSVSGVISSTDTSLKTKNFLYNGPLYTGKDYYIEGTSLTGNGVTLRVYLEANGPAKADGTLKKDECRGNADFCASMGYANCDGSVCVK